MKRVNFSLAYYEIYNKVFSYYILSCFLFIVIYVYIKTDTSFSIILIVVQMLFSNKMESDYLVLVNSPDSRYNIKEEIQTFEVNKLKQDANVLFFIIVVITLIIFTLDNNFTEDLDLYTKHIFISIIIWIFINWYYINKIFIYNKSLERDERNLTKFNDKYVKTYKKSMNTYHKNDVNKIKKLSNKRWPLIEKLKYFEDTFK